MSLDKLKAGIKGGTPSRVYLFWGKEEFLIAHYLKEIEKIVVDKAFKNFNYQELKEKYTPHDVIQICEVPPAFSNKKLVVVKNSGWFEDTEKGKKGKRSTEGDKEALTEYIKNLPDYICLIFIEAGAKAETDFYKAVKDNGLCVEFPINGVPELTKWAAKKIEANGLKVGKESAEYLVTACGPSMNDLSNEIEKLINYVEKGNTVEKDHIDLLCVKSLQNKVFEMIDCITDGKSEKAYELLNDLIILKEPLQKVTALVAKHFKTLYFTKEMIRAGNNTSMIANKLKINAYFIGKYIKQANKYKQEKLREAMDDCLEMDKKVKLSKIDHRIALENIIAKYSV